jgi:restriction system protein
MSAPTWDQYMAPSLRVLLDGEVHRSRGIVEGAVELLRLTPEQRQIVIPSGQEQWVNRGNWALSYLTRVGAIERTSRAHYRITDVGRKLLEEHSDGIRERDLRALSGDPNAPHTWKAFPSPAEDASVVVPETDTTLDPQEQIEAGIARIHADIAAQLLARLHAQEPAFFEQAVLDLLMAMGYGGAEGKATRTRLSSDGGIDGVVDQDALGLSRIYVQAKRYALDSSVGRPEIQAFVDALHGKQANQGVFITSGRFSPGAREYAANLPTRVVLIDGERLAALMIRYGVGVQVKRTVHIVEVDEDFFE